MSGYSKDISEHVDVFTFAQPINEKDQGMQGEVFRCMWKGEASIMKKSKHVDFVLELEEEAWTLLKTLNCVHFCEVLDRIPVTPGSQRYCLFFKEITNNLCKRDSLANLIFERQHHPNALLNCVRQTLAAMVMFESLGITHYDLHADNVMITDAPYDIHVYKFGDDLIPIRTYGLAPVIIDFGLAHLPDFRYNASSVFAMDGFTTYMSDPFVDSRLLLLTSTKELGDLVTGSKQKSQYSTIDQFNKKVELIFKDLKLERNGWFQKEGMFPNIMGELGDQFPLSIQNIKKGVFKDENICWILELLQHEVTIPVLQYKLDVPPFNKTLVKLVVKWKMFVEPVIRNTFEEQLFFKDLVAMPSEPSIDDYVKMNHRYPKIKNIKMLRRLTKTLGDAFSNFIYEKSIEAKLIKDRLYSTIPYKSTKDILLALPSKPIKYHEHMSMIVMDPKSPNHKTIMLSKRIASMLNENEQETLKYILSDQNNEETQRVHY